MRASWPLLAACLTALCQCSLFVGVDGIDDGTGRDAGGQDASVGPRDGTASETSIGPIEAAGLPDAPAAEPSDVDGGPVLDSAAEVGSVPDAPVTSLEASLDASLDAKATLDAHDGAMILLETGAPDAGRACDPAKPFAPPVLIPGVQVNGAKDAAFRLLPDELTGYFWSVRAGGATDLYVTTRPDSNSPFGTPLLLNNVNLNGVWQMEPSASSDGLDLAFRSPRGGGVGGSDIYWASRADLKSDFANVTLLANVNSTANDVQPFVAGSPNGTTLYFASDRSGDYDIYRAVGSAGRYGSPQPVTELNTAAVKDDQPVASDDNRTMFFSSARAGGLGSNDIWMATRPSDHVPFGTPTNLTQVNTTGLDRPDWISLDGCRLYLSSDITGVSRLYMATRGM
ncbi:MAG: hypothetical protein M3O50_03455 [Myxococcota bacterium]|nr:hypothetical protein [Myxococcota bacterium]